jgi:hypothetical protein
MATFSPAFVAPRRELTEQGYTDFSRAHWPDGAKRDIRGFCRLSPTVITTARWLLRTRI